MDSVFSISSMPPRQTQPLSLGVDYVRIGRHQNSSQWTQCRQVDAAAALLINEPLLGPFQKRPGFGARRPPPLEAGRFLDLTN